MSQIEQDNLFTLTRFGNLTASSMSEVLVCGRGYVEPASQAQRSLVSTSVQDKPGGSGAAKVRVTFLNSAYELKTEDVILNGTSAVDMLATDLRFVEDLRVIQGTAAVGAVKLMSSTGGGGSEITGIGAATECAFLAHHYIPAGKTGYILGWEVSCDDECRFKLKGQGRYDGNLVDENIDLRNLTAGNPTPPTRLEGSWPLQGIKRGEMTYCRITVVPVQATSTIIRARLTLWEE